MASKAPPASEGSLPTSTSGSSLASSSGSGSLSEKRRPSALAFWEHRARKVSGASTPDPASANNDNAAAAAASTSASLPFLKAGLVRANSLALSSRSSSSGGAGAGTGTVAAPSSPSQGSSSDRTSMQSRRSQSTVRADEGGSARASTEWNASRTSTEQRKVAAPTIVGLDEEVAAQDRRLSAERRRLNNNNNNKDDDEASSLLDVTHAQHGAGAGVVLVNRKPDYEADDLGAGGLSMRSYEAFFPEPGSSGASSSSARSSRISARSTEQGAETSGELTAGSSGQSQHRASSERVRGEAEASTVQARGAASASATSAAMTPSHSATSLASTSSSSRARAVSCLDARLSPSQSSHRESSAHRLSASSRARHERGGSSTPRSRRGSKDVSGASSPLLHASSSAGSMERATHSRSHSLLASLDGRMGASRTLLEGTAYSSDEEDGLHDDRASSTVSPTGSATGRDAAARERRKRRLLKSQIRKRQSRRRSASLRSATGAGAGAMALEDELSDDFAESGSSEGGQEGLGHVRGSTSFDEADDELQLARLAPQHAQQQQQRRRRLSTPATVRNNDEALLTTSLGIGGARNSSADRAVTPGGVSTGSDSFYDANLSSPSSSASSPSHSTLEAASLHAHDASTSAHRLGSGRSKERTADESHEATAAWLNVSPRPTEMNSSATLRQDALDGESRREPSLAASAGHALPSIPSPNGSSAGTPPTDWGVASFRSPESSGTMSSAITASTTVSSTRGASLDLSPPVSPLSPNSSFMASFVGHSPRIFSSGIAGAANTKASELRASRIAALPPPRPTPTSPLPPPPQSGFAAQQQQQQRPAPPPQPLFVERRARSSDASQSRLRSQSLSQAAAGLTITAGSGGGTYEQERGAVSAGSLGVGAEPMMRSRSNSQVPSKARASASRGDASASAAAGAAAAAAGGALLIPQARPPLSRRSSSSTASAMPLPPTAEEVPSLPSSPAAPQPATLGPSGTIRGRPRGATVGAVPAASSTSARFTVPTRTRPRSMLSHEITHESQQQQQQQQGFEASQLAASSSSPLGAPSAGTTIASRRASMSTSSQSVTTGETSLATPTTAASSATDSALARRGLTLVTQQQQQCVVTDAAATAPRSSTSSSSAAGASLGGGGVGAGTSTSHSGGGAGAGEGRSSGGSGARSRSGSNASLLQQVQYPPKSHASFVIAVVGHHGAGKSTVIKKGLRQFGLSKPNVLSEKIASHSTICIVDQEQRTIEVLEMDASVLLNGPSKRFAWPKFLPHIDAVILCYDASQISSFRGMSELLENFAIHDLSTVMLACKSEIFPKAVDPYYASDMAAVYNVGLAECSVQSEEGKKRMRDCFSYLVKEVAKARAGRRAPAESSSGAGGAGSMPPLLGSGMRKLSDATTASMDSRASSISQQPSPTLSSGGFSSPGGEGTSSLARIIQSTHLAGQDVRNTSRKMSDATTASADAPSYVGSNSEDEVALQHSISKAQLGLQSAKSVGGYVTIEALWEKLFFAAVSGDDERFLLMFMVFYRGFARPIDLLRQLIARFDALAHSERSDGVMIRFSLMRLTAMLGDWMQDYPGDLSAPETFGELYKFFDRLLQHPSTMHIASPLQQHLEMVRNAPDPDAAWSKNQDNDKPRSVAADVPPVRPALAEKKLSGMEGVTPGLESFQDMTRLRAYSDTSAVSVAQSEASGSQGSRAHNAAVENRQRSASDLTSSSDGQHGGVSTSQVALPSSSASSTVQSSSVAASSSDGFSPATPAPAAPLGDSASSRKLALRSVSNAIGDMDEEVIAAELTRIEWGLFCAIRPRDLLRHILVARELRERNGPVARSIAHFNYISYWVCSMILVQGKTKHRARMLEKFMSVAAILRHSNNYNTLHAVLAGLGNASIHRLKHTRELLNGKAVNKIYLSLARLMGSDRSFAAYRMALENSEGRTIPYLGVHLQDILSTSDGNPSKRASDGMIHWRKFSLMDEAVMAIVRCQSYDRPTARPNVMVEKLIVDLPVMDEEDLYQRSLQVEPRASQSNSSLASTKIKEFFHAN